MLHGDPVAEPQVGGDELAVRVHRPVDDGQRLGREGPGLHEERPQLGYDRILEVECGCSSRGRRAQRGAQVGQQRAGRGARWRGRPGSPSWERGPRGTAAARPTPRATRVPRRPSVSIRPARASCDQAALTVAGATSSSRATLRIGGSRSPGRRARRSIPAEQGHRDPLGRAVVDDGDQVSHTFRTITIPGLI